MPKMPGHLNRYLILLAIALFAFIQCYPSQRNDSTITSKRRINIIVSSKSRHIDLAAISFQFQAHVQQLFHRKELCFIITGSLNELKDRIKKIMDRENAKIGSIWFDSHGHMGRRVSLIEIGQDEINYQSIRDAYISNTFHEIGNYCDSNTLIGLGSCYSASTSVLPPFEKFPAQRMNGDSLMIMMSELMNKATIFGTESWVMTYPGIFNSGNAFAGKPGNNRFKDPLFRSSWKTLGEWTSYSATNNCFRKARTISLDGSGNILINYKTYLAKEKSQKKQMKIISRLKAGNFNTKYFYQYEFPINNRVNHVVKTKPAQHPSEKMTGE